MLHLDEGTLQAWLDHPRSGLEPSEVAEIERHLASCPACAAELEALRSSDREAHSLLASGVDRSVPAPPFEEVVRRARGRDDVRRARRRLNRLAWAASLVVAIGVGWLSNDLYRTARTSEATQGRSPVATPSRETPRAPEELEAVQVPAEPDARASDDDQLAGARQEASAAAAAELRDQAGRADAEPSPDLLSRTNEVAGAGAPPVADLAAPPPPTAAAERVRQAAPVEADDSIVVSGVVADDQGKPVASAQVFVDGRQIGTLTQQDGSYRLSLPARDSAAPIDLTVERIGYRRETQELSGRPGEPVVADFRLQEEALQLQEVVVTGTQPAAQRRALGNAVGQVNAVEPYTWRDETREAAEAVLGRPLVTLPGLAIRTVEVADSGIVRVRQDLGDAVMLTLVQGRGGEGRESWSIESVGALASAHIGDLIVTATAPVTEDSLRALLGEVR
jgi:hypothetical protein